MSTGPNPNGYCVWTKNGSVWVATDFCRSGCQCAANQQTSAGGPTLSDSDFQMFAAANGITLDGTEQTVTVGCVTSPPNPDW